MVSPFKYFTHLVLVQSLLSAIIIALYLLPFYIYQLKHLLYSLRSLKIGDW